jgi:hypothetical protein
MNTKANKLLLAIISAAAISGGGFLVSVEPAEACPFSQKFQAGQDGSGGKPSYTAKGYKIAKTLGGIVIGTGLIGCGTFMMSRCQRQAATAKASTYQALEFPSELSFDNKLESKTQEMANHN